MILSMTGYGKKSVQFLNKKITCEIKSLNSKALDLTTRVAPLYREREMEVRTLVGGALVRGKVECALWFEQESVCEGSVLNVPLMKEYLRQMLEAEQDGIPAPHDIGGALLRMPEVMTRHTEDALSEEEWQTALEAVRGALEQLTEFRRQEGEALERKFREKVDNIERLLAEIEPFEKGRKERIRSRMLEALEAIPEAQYDQNRLEQEMIFYIEKLDISEEKQRLANHLNYFRETLEGEAGQGKKLGFIAQEMGREINTTGSKSNQAEMQLIVVGMKDELEQIKEQVLNVL